MIFIIAGSRGIIDMKLVAIPMQTIRSVFHVEVDEVVSGCAKGVDTLGEEWAHLNDIPVKHFPAKWNRHGRSAGPIRNGEMAAYADGLLAVYSGDRPTAGTGDMIKQALKKRLLVFVHNGSKTEMLEGFP